MRITKIDSPQITLHEAVQQFLSYKSAQHIAERTLCDYQKHLRHFLSSSQNSLDYSLLTSDVLAYFSAIPPTSPARYNLPYQYINAFFNWAVK